MKAECENRTVLITGATDGLGKAAAILLAERGYRVYAAGRSAEKRAQLDQLAKSKNLPLKSLELDVTSDDSVRTGVHRVTQAVLPHMRERRSGRILMISSVAGLVSPPTYGAYSSSKHALEGLSNALRLELFPFNIQVVLIEPGYIVTNFQQTAKELAQPYVESSRASPYVKIYSGAWAGANEGRDSSKSTPEDCARVIFEAIESPNPRARYGVTALPTVVKWAKRLASDRMVDAFLRRKYRVTREDGPPPTTSV